MSVFITIFIIIASIYALGLLGYVGYDIVTKIRKQRSFEDADGEDSQ